MSVSVREVAVHKVAESLIHRFPKVPANEVSAIVGEEYDLLAGNPIRLYVANLVEHEARERLRRAS